MQSSRPWTPNATITLTIEDGSGGVYADSQTADASGGFYFDLWSTFNIQRGHVVTVSDGTTTKTHTVVDLFVDGVDPTADTVFGRAGASSDVQVWVHGNGDVWTTTDSSGNWMADFSSQTDLTYASDGGSQVFDEDGDATGVWWASPRFEAAPVDNWVRSLTRWEVDAPLSLTIEEGGMVVYTAVYMTDTGGSFHIDLSGFDLQTGHVVTVSDGTTTKTHTVTAVDVDDIDTTGDRIHGTAVPGASVQVWVGLFDNGSNRWVMADVSGNWTADFSVERDGQPVYDITPVTRVNVDEFDNDGDATYRQFGPPIPQNRGVAVTPLDNHVWVACSGAGTVTRLDNNGNVLAVIETGSEPTGVAVDAGGKVWATNMGSNNAVRIDPQAGADGLGAVDLTVDLGPEASPYNYSDMTGTVAVVSTSPQGFWTVVQDSQRAGFAWGHISWNREPEGSVPAGSAIVVEARAADSMAGLGGQPFVAVDNDVPFNLSGRYIEVRVTLKASPDARSPVLSDVRIAPTVTPVVIDIKPGSFPNSINLRNQGDIPVAILSTADFDATAVDPLSVAFGPAGAPESHGRGHIEDVDHDGDLDLVLHFLTQASGILCGDTSASLTGMTFDGLAVAGSDSIRTVGCK